MGEYNLEINQGSEWERTLILKDSTGAVINLTGYTAKMQIRALKDKNSQLYDTLSTAVGNLRIVITALEGKLVLKIPSTVSDNYTFIKGYYDLEIVTSTGLVTRILEGNVSINKNVTK